MLAMVTQIGPEKLSRVKVLRGYHCNVQRSHDVQQEPEVEARTAESLTTALLVEHGCKYPQFQQWTECTPRGH